MKPLRIFVAYPYSASTPEEVHRNVCRAMEIGMVLEARGHVPFIPHLTHTWHLHNLSRYGSSLQYEEWMRQTLAWVPVCDAILHTVSSPGADRELALAEELGLLVFTCIAEVPCVE